MSDSLTERRLKAGLDALAANLTQHGVPTVDTVRAILAASDRALAVAGSEEVLRKAVKAATDAGACKDHSVLGSGHMEYASSCTKCIAIKLRAARPLLVAPERAEVERRHEQAQAEIARLRKELAFARTMAPPNAFGAHTMAGLLSDAEEHKRELATLRQEHERVRVNAMQFASEVFAALHPECPQYPGEPNACHSENCDCGQGMQAVPAQIATLRRRLAEVEKERASMRGYAERALERYRRSAPCSCHDCRREAGHKDGVGTNGGCHHFALRALISRLSAPQAPEGV